MDELFASKEFLDAVALLQARMPQLQPIIKKIDDIANTKEFQQSASGSLIKEQFYQATEDLRHEMVIIGIYFRVILTIGVVNSAQVPAALTLTQ